MQFKAKEIFTISNSLSFFRLLLFIPLIILIREINTENNLRIIIFSIGIIALITDLLDGYLARKLNQITEFGKIIDPLADKFFVFGLVFGLYIVGEISPFYFWLIILRDVIIFIGGIFVSKKINYVLPSNYLGKMTVVSIGVFLSFVILNANPESFLFNFFYYLSILLSVASVIGYVFRAVEAIKWYKNENI